jgi:hypothetical protein
VVDYPIKHDDNWIIKAEVIYMNMKKTIAILLLIVTGIAPSVNISGSPSGLKCGTVGTTVTNPSVKVGNLQDTAYTYTGADVVVYDYGVEIDNYVTIAVIDDGLTDKEWKALEQNPEANVQITYFITETSTGSIKSIYDYDDPYLDNQVHHGHGFEVISVIASIARDVKVIFIDLQVTSESDNDPYGFEYGEYKIWEWIDNNQASKDIDIVNFSWVNRVDFTEGTSIHQKWSSLKSKNVMFLTPSGNFYSAGNRQGSLYWKYQSYYTEWYSIGSIDHENRDGSWKGSKSWFSSWYEATPEENRIVNWLEPGNGIPVLTNAYYDSSLHCYRGTWKYAYGTSYSSAYLAAIVALIITGYHNGIGSSTDPSVQKVIDILHYASSRSTFDTFMGYGYVDAYTAYGKAFMEGRLA